MQKPARGIQKIAVERMHRLDELARENAQNHPERSQRYVKLIQKLSTRFRTPIPFEIKNQFCKKCGNYWIEGENVKRRLKNEMWNNNCQICGSLTRRKAR
jgi:ribonuclease P protein subunit RPR2